MNICKSASIKLISIIHFSQLQSYPSNEVISRRANLTYPSLYSVQRRSCTDSICLFIFFLLTIAILGVGTYSWIYGNFKKLTHPYDPDGKGCGVDYPDYPYIYFASPHADSLWVTVCVSACPTESDSSLKCQTNSVVTSCNPNNSSDDTKKVEIYDSSASKNILTQLLARSVCQVQKPSRTLSTERLAVPAGRSLP